MALYQNPVQFLAPQWENAGVLDSAANFLYQLIGKNSPYKLARRSNQQVDDFFASPQGQETAARFGLPTGQQFNAGALNAFGTAGGAGQQGNLADIGRQQAAQQTMNTQFQEDIGGVPMAITAQAAGNPFIGPQLLQKFFGLGDTMAGGANDLLDALNQFREGADAQTQPGAGAAKPSGAREAFQATGQRFQQEGVPGVVGHPVETARAATAPLAPIGNAIERFLQGTFLGPETARILREGEMGTPGQPLPLREGPYMPPEQQQQQQAPQGGPPAQQQVPQISPQQMDAMFRIFQRLGLMQSQ